MKRLEQRKQIHNKIVTRVYVKDKYCRKHKKIVNEKNEKIKKNN